MWVARGSPAAIIFVPRKRKTGPESGGAQRTPWRGGKANLAKSVPTVKEGGRWVVRGSPAAIISAQRKSKTGSEPGGAQRIVSERAVWALIGCVFVVRVSVDHARCATATRGTVKESCRLLPSSLIEYR